MASVFGGFCFGGCLPGLGWMVTRSFSGSMITIQRCALAHLTRNSSGEGQGLGLPPERRLVSAAALSTSLRLPRQWKSGDTFMRHSSSNFSHGVAGGGFCFLEERPIQLPCPIPLPPPLRVHLEGGDRLALSSSSVPTPGNEARNSKDERVRSNPRTQAGRR